MNSLTNDFSPFDKGDSRGILICCSESLLTSKGRNNHGSRSIASNPSIRFALATS